jgi:hypothetical protein
MGLFDEIEKGNHKFKPGKTTLEEFDEVVKAMDTKGASPGPIYYMSGNMHGYLGAVMNNDKKGIQHYQTIFTRDHFLGMKRDHLKVQEKYPEAYDAFCEIDIKHTRHNGVSRADFKWYIDHYYENEKTYDYQETMLELQDGLFKLYVYFSDEYGFDHETILLGEKIKPGEILDRLSRL